MDKKIKDEMLQVAILFAVSLVMFKLLFFKEDVLTVIKVVSAFFYTFIIPGYALMFYWNEQLDFLERLIIGTVLGLALFGIMSYYTGLVGLHLKFMSILLPGLFVLAASFFYFKGK